MAPGTTFDGAGDQYDGRNYRVVKLVAAPKSVAPAAWHRTDLYYNEGWQVLEERQAREVSPANKGVEAAAVHVQWAWDARYIDAAVLRWRDGNLDGDLADAEDDTLYYCNDANMNVTALVDAATGAAVERYLYDPYGRVTFLNGDWTWTKTLGPDGQPNTADDGTTSNYANEVLYCGYRYDFETGLYHVRNRMFSPATGGWINRDPSVYAAGMNLGEYVTSNPVLFVDDTGLGPRMIATEDQYGRTYYDPRTGKIDRSEQSKHLPPTHPENHYYPEVPKYWPGSRTESPVGQGGDIEPLGADTCKWKGTITANLYGTLFAQRMTIAVNAFGSDGTCNYAVSAEGSSWLTGWVWSAGWLKLSASFKDFTAPCKWPVAKGDSAVMTVVGVGGNVGLPVSPSWITGIAGKLRGQGWFDTGGVNVFAAGGGFAATIHTVERVGPTPR